MKKYLLPLFMLLSGVVVGGATVLYWTSAKIAPAVRGFAGPTVQTEPPGLSPIEYWGDYGKLSNSVEVRLDHQGILVDGTACDDKDLDAAILRQKSRIGASYLVLVTDDTGRLGPTVELAAHLRTLGFECLYLAPTRNSEDEEKLWSKLIPGVAYYRP